MPIEAETSGEKIIQLEGKIDVIDGKVTYVIESLERVITAFEKLETTRLTDHEKRLLKIEKWMSEWSGAYKVIALAGFLLGVVATIKSFL